MITVYYIHSKGVMVLSVERLGIPIYGLALDHENDLLVAVGGGGSSKSGVKNIVVIIWMIAKRALLWSD